MKTETARPLGAIGEDLAAEHLQRLGYTILRRNYRTRSGEIDIVASDRGVLVFCEVKTRRAPGDPWDNLHDRKRQQVRRIAACYLAAMPDRPQAHEIRFDAIGIVIDRQGALMTLDHIEAAF